jgi:pilus assembly protein TadC
MAAVAVTVGGRADPGRLQRRRWPPPGVSDVALAVDLVAAALRSGLPLASALRVVAGACGTHGTVGPGLDRLATVVESGQVPDVDPDGDTDPLAALTEAVAFAVRSGAPIAPLLAEAARTVRRRRRDAAVRAAGRLSAALVLPLGLAALPGFLLLGIAPVVVRLVTSLA